MPVRIVESRQNARVKELRRALASGGRVERGLLGIEGPNLVEEALRAGLRVKTIFVAQGSERFADALCLPPGTEVLQLPRKLLESVLATETPQPLAALVEPPDWTWAHAVGDPRESALILVLAGVQDPGNLGTIVRSAEAFDASGVLCLPGTVSVWNPKAVRASAGSVFRVPVIAASDKECFEKLHRAGAKIYATTVCTARPANQVDLAGPVAFVIGNEGSGVPREIAAKADGAVTIPCPGPVESLNAAVAASVLLYEASRQRAAASGDPAHRRGGKR